MADDGSGDSAGERDRVAVAVVGDTATVVVEVDDAGTHAGAACLEADRALVNVFVILVSFQS
jgi:hypothetical protein